MNHRMCRGTIGSAALAAAVMVGLAGCANSSGAGAGAASSSSSAATSSPSTAATDAGSADGSKTDPSAVFESWLTDLIGGRYRTVCKESAWVQIPLAAASASSLPPPSESHASSAPSAAEPTRASSISPSRSIGTADRGISGTPRGCPTAPTHSASSVAPRENARAMATGPASRSRTEGQAARPSAGSAGQTQPNTAQAAATITCRRINVALLLSQTSRADYPRAVHDELAYTPTLVETLRVPPPAAALT